MDISQIGQLSTTRNSSIRTTASTTSPASITSVTTNQIATGSSNSPLALSQPTSGYVNPKIFFKEIFVSLNLDQLDLAKYGAITESSSKTIQEQWLDIINSNERLYVELISLSPESINELNKVFNSKIIDLLIINDNSAETMEKIFQLPNIHKISGLAIRNTKPESLKKMKPYSVKNFFIVNLSQEAIAELNHLWPAVGVNIEKFYAFQLSKNVGKDLAELLHKCCCKVLNYSDPSYEEAYELSKYLCRSNSQVRVLYMAKGSTECIKTLITPPSPIVSFCTHNSEGEIMEEICSIINSPQSKIIILGIKLNPEVAAKFDNKIFYKLQTLKLMNPTFTTLMKIWSNYDFNGTLKHLILTQIEKNELRKFLNKMWDLQAIGRQKLRILTFSPLDSETKKKLNIFNSLAYQPAPHQPILSNPVVKSSMAPPSYSSGSKRILEDPEAPEAKKLRLNVGSVYLSLPMYEGKNFSGLYNSFTRFWIHKCIYSYQKFKTFDIELYRKNQAFRSQSHESPLYQLHSLLMGDDALLRLELAQWLNSIHLDSILLGETPFY